MQIKTALVAKKYTWLTGFRLLKQDKTHVVQNLQYHPTFDGNLNSSRPISKSLVPVRVTLLADRVVFAVVEVVVAAVIEHPADVDARRTAHF